MKRLTAIQKTFRVFEVISKVAMIFSFVWAGLTVTGLLCSAVWYSGSRIAGFGRETLLFLTLTDSLGQMVGVLLSELVFALANGVLFLFAFRYFRQEQADGTPFTENGAEQVEQLGVQTIILPLVAAILSASFYGVFDLTGVNTVDQGYLFSISLGILLILAAQVFRYGAELEAGKEAA